MAIFVCRAVRSVPRYTKPDRPWPIWSPTSTSSPVLSSMLILSLACTRSYSWASLVAPLAPPARQPLSTASMSGIMRPASVCPSCARTLRRSRSSLISSMSTSVSVISAWDWVPLVSSSIFAMISATSSSMASSSSSSSSLPNTKLSAVGAGRCVRSGLATVAAAAARSKVVAWTRLKMSSQSSSRAAIKSANRFVRLPPRSCTKVLSDVFVRRFWMRLCTSIRWVVSGESFSATAMRSCALLLILSRCGRRTLARFFRRRASCRKD